MIPVGAGDPAGDAPVAPILRCACGRSVSEAGALFDVVVGTGEWDPSHSFEMRGLRGVCRITQGGAPPTAYLPSVDPLDLDPTGSLEGLAALMTLVLVIIGFVVASVPAVVDFLLRSRTRVRLGGRVAFVAAYAGIGIWVYGSLGSEYARSLSQVDPEGECRGFGGDNSGCLPWHGQRYWPIIWAMVGLTAVVLTRLVANKARRRDELADYAIG